MADETVQTLKLKIKAVLDKSSINGVLEEVKDGMQSLDHETGGATKSVGSFTSALKSAAKIGLAPLGLMAKASLGSVKLLGKGVLTATKRVLGFFSALKRIAVYRAIRWALKQITQGFQEGIQNAYQWSVITGNQFARSMDTMATSALYLKNSLGAMTMPLVNTLAPILDAITDKFVTLINYVNQFIATLTGASSWTRALKYPAEYMEAASGSAKELKNQLFGFDELNVLNAPSGGGSASALDYSKMFENMTLDKSKFSFANFLRDAIKKGDWKGVGAELGRRLTKVLNSLEPKKIAKALGEKINTAVTTLHAFLSATDFDLLGSTITEFLTNLNINWQAVSTHIFTWGTKLFDFILGAVKGINWKSVASAIGNFFVGAVNTVSDFIRNINWVKIIDTLAQGFLDVIKGIPWGQLILALGNALISLVTSAFNLLTAPARKLINWILGVSFEDEFNSAIARINGAANPGGTGHSSTGTTYITGGQGNAITGSGNSHEHGAVYDFGFASGGFPRMGSYFYAGEDGAELVGQIGGRTGVMNTDQMADSLASANEGVINAIAAMGNAVVSAINNKQVGISTNDVRIAMRNLNMRYGV